MLTNGLIAYYKSVAEADANIDKDTNKEIVDKFETHSEYKDYNPHMTIAYMKKGMADKYLKKILDKLILLKAKNFNISSEKSPSFRWR